MMRARWTLSTMVALAAPGAAVGGGEEARTIAVDLRLRTGGGIGGLVVEHDEHGIVIVREKTPYAFSWSEIEPGRAYVAWRKILVLERGGEERLTAQDYFDVGRFALRVGRNDLAADEFARAGRMDRSFERRARRAFEEFREQRAIGKGQVHEPFRGDPEPNEPGDGARNSMGGAAEGSDDPAVRPDDTRAEAFALPPLVETNALVAPSPEEVRTRVMDAYRTFGAKVREVLGKNVVLVETEHFLIWTDWDARDRPRLAEWSEAVYLALQEQFGLDPSASVFLAKCPMFCWRNKAGFRKFARYFDGYAANDAVGYTRSIEKNGHVHVVLVRTGDRTEDLDRFASTLVHEGTHAFLHRLHTTRLIPHWVNEGLANVMAERVLAERCDNAETAALLARPYVRHGWPIGEFLRNAGPIGVEQYALAHSVVECMLSDGRDRFAGFIRGLKDGRTLAEALNDHFDGLSLEGLEARWREWVRRTDPSLRSGEATQPVSQVGPSATGSGDR